MGKLTPKQEALYGKNDLIADHGEWVEVDISTKKWPNKVMKIDKAGLGALREAGIGRFFYASCGYVQCMMGGKTTYVHRILLPGSKVVDHKNHDTLDNRMKNLRACTQVENMRNSGRRKNNTSGHRGVSWSKRSKKWQVHVMVNRKSIFIGMFESINNAVSARKEAELKYFGEYAYSQEVTLT